MRQNRNKRHINNKRMLRKPKRQASFPNPTVNFSLQIHGQERSTSQRYRKKHLWPHKRIMGC